MEIKKVSMLGNSKVLKVPKTEVGQEFMILTIEEYNNIIKEKK